VNAAPPDAVSPDALPPEAGGGRLVIVPGLHDSPPGHWQHWLQSLHPRAIRVQQRDWAVPDLEAWSRQVGAVLERPADGRFIVVAHSFGVLALARHLQRHPRSPVAAALLVAPADPDKFGVAGLLPQGPLPVPATLVLSANDPWLNLTAGWQWARRWRVPVVELGEAGHVNAAAGFGRWPFAQQWVLRQRLRLRQPRAAAAWPAPPGGLARLRFPAAPRTPRPAPARPGPACAGCAARGS
jgi:predicted alpha/beta hydrolase family esterase